MYLKVVTIFLVSSCFWLSACSPSQNVNGGDVIKEDVDSIYTVAIPDVLTLDNAITLALDNNLDAKIAEQDFIVSLTDVDLQKLNALPTITAQREFVNLSNDRASSSISAETGVVSLEPSISTDRSRRTDLVEANWQLMDAAINIYRSRSTLDQAQIAKERYRRVQQNVILDTYSAFWRLAFLQAGLSDVELLLAESEQKLSVLETAKAAGDIPLDRITNLQKEIFSLRSDLLEVKKGYDLSSLELKALLSIAPQTPIALSFDRKDLDVAKSFNNRQSLNHFVNAALSKRPEIREEVLNLRIAKRNVNDEILQTFPGLSLLASGTDDDNSFLEDSQFLSLTTTLSQSITRLLTLPTRLKKSKQEIELANARRRALVAAVVFQVNLSYAGYEKAYAEFLEGNRSFGVSEEENVRKALMKEAGLLGGLEGLLDSMQFQLDKAQANTRLVDLLVAQANLRHNVGYDFEDYIDHGAKSGLYEVAGYE